MFRNIGVMTVVLVVVAVAGLAVYHERGQQHGVRTCAGVGPAKLCTGKASHTGTDELIVCPSQADVSAHRVTSVPASCIKPEGPLTLP